MAANGNASFSPVNAAVPNPCAAAPMPSPLATGSLIPHRSRIDAPKLAPSSPLTTTKDTAIPTSAPSIPAMAMARGEVMFRLSSARRTPGAPVMRSRRTRKAVPNSPPAAEPVTPAATSLAFCRTSSRRPYICRASEITAGPRRKRRRSPGPVVHDPVRYPAKVARKEEPVSLPSAATPVQESRVQTTRGCSALVIFGGSRAP
mmetsp:Transcript_19153/g.43606  ORF Transcript_19153/g.43606 Transcript_19153/m.43606 type:complete len:203 (-) Transcript_19153:957-1565(-)